MAVRRVTWRERPWLRFAGQRLGGLVLSFAVLVVVTFVIVPLIPGDPAVAVAGQEATGAEVARIRAELGLDQPLHVQFLDYVGGLLTLDLGTSFSNGQDVATVILARLPFTAELALFAIALVLVISVPVGMLVAFLTHGGRRSWLDHLFNVVTSLVYSVPQYVMATLLVVVFAVGLGMFPAAGAETLSSLVLPTLALMLLPMCVVSRVVRRETAVVLDQDYIRTAKGWRIGRLRLFGRYVLPNVITTTLTLSGLILAAQLGGAVVIETVFAFPGLGQGVVQAILERDYPVIRGTILVLGLMATLIISVVDVILAIIDPRSIEADHD
ncbi:ABC transporter permease [Pseudonocardia sp. MH-G8]|uniref:ABC transporter permease n=1 Tax=Pseudonocardia sp. MH-G8 TaxID=1854588 RepID=UPI000B9FD041|nr:ABC transporter permease [Pseudonocardia sp. MH-G8]OZM76529.1 peptide ABC transporter permease [Pseudonocardia sp. MH-G8]